MIIRKAFIILLCTLLMGCTPIASRAERAEKTLIEFFDLLNQEDYQTATAYYGGNYETLIGMNPTLTPSNHALLLAYACRKNGFACRQILKTTFLDLSGSDYSFEVEIMNADGTQLSRGACCGEDLVSVEPQITFIYRVLETKEGGYLVLDLPVYIP